MSLYSISFRTYCELEHFCHLLRWSSHYSWIFSFMITYSTLSPDAGPVAFSLSVKHIVSLTILSTERVADGFTATGVRVEGPPPLNNQTEGLEVCWVGRLDTLTCNRSWKIFWNCIHKSLQSLTDYWKIPIILNEDILKPLPPPQMWCRSAPFNINFYVTYKFYYICVHKVKFQ